MTCRTGAMFTIDVTTTERKADQRLVMNARGRDHGSLVNKAPSHWDHKLIHRSRGGSDIKRGFLMLGRGNVKALGAETPVTPTSL